MTIEVDRSKLEAGRRERSHQDRQGHLQRNRLGGRPGSKRSQSKRRCQLNGNDLKKKAEHNFVRLLREDGNCRSRFLPDSGRERSKRLNG